MIWKEESYNAYLIKKNLRKEKTSKQDHSGGLSFICFCICYPRPTMKCGLHFHFRKIYLLCVQNKFNKTVKPFFKTIIESTRSLIVLGRFNSNYNIMHEAKKR